MMFQNSFSPLNPRSFRNLFCTLISITDLGITVLYDWSIFALAKSIPNLLFAYSAPLPKSTKVWVILIDFTSGSTSVIEASEPTDLNHILKAAKARGKIEDIMTHENEIALLTK